MLFVGGPTFFVGTPILFIGPPSLFIGAPILFLGEPECNYEKTQDYEYHKKGFFRQCRRKPS